MDTSTQFDPSTKEYFEIYTKARTYRFPTWQGAATIAKRRAAKTGQPVEIARHRPLWNGWESARYRRITADGITQRWVKGEWLNPGESHDSEGRIVAKEGR